MLKQGAKKQEVDFQELEKMLQPDPLGARVKSEISKLHIE